MTGHFIHRIGYDWITEQGDMTCSVCLSEKERMIILSILEQTNWETRWYKFDETELSQSEIEQIHDWYEKLTGKLLMPCDDSTVPSPNELLTANLEIQIAQSAVSTYFNRYDGTPSSVHPEAPDDNFDGDGSGTRQNALCLAVESWIAGALQTLRNQLIAAGLVSIVSLGLSWFIPIPIIFAAVASTALMAAYSVGVIFDALEDKAAQQEVICCVYSILLGLPIDHANFQFAFETGTCGIVDQSHADTLIRQLFMYSQDQLNYVSFLNQLGVAFVLANNGVQGECDCGCSDLAFDFVAGVDELGWVEATLVDFPANDIMNNNPNQQGYNFVREPSGVLASGGFATNDYSLGGIYDLGTTCGLTQAAVTFQAQGIGSTGFQVAMWNGSSWQYVGGFLSTVAGIPGGFHRFVAILNAGITGTKVAIVLNAPNASQTSKIELFFT